MITFQDMSFDPRSSMILLIAGSVATFLSLALSAVSIYFSRRTIMRMARNYEEYCAKRVFRLLGLNAAVFAAAPEDAKKDMYLFRLIKGDAKMAGRVLRMALGLIVPVITLVAAISVLFYLQFRFTLLIALLGTVFLFFQYKVSKKAVDDSMSMEKLGGEASRQYKELLQCCKQRGYPDTSQDALEKIFARGPVKRHLDAYEGRIVAGDNSFVVSGLFMAVVISLIILVMGHAIITQGAGWGRLLVYILALRYAMANLQSTFKILTGINRFYPQLQRTFYFVQGVDHKDADQFPALPEYTIPLDRSAPTEDLLHGSETSALIHPGTRIALVTSLELNRYAMLDIISALADDTETPFKNIAYSTRFATTTHSCPTLCLRELLCLPPDGTWDEMRLPLQVKNRLRKSLPKNLDARIRPKMWEVLEPELKFLLSFFFALRSECQWIMVEEKGLRLLDPEIRLPLLEEGDAKILVVVHRKQLGRVGDYGENTIVVMNERTIQGLGSPEWFDSVRKEAKTIIESETGKKTSSEGSEPDDDDLDEM
jgi:hypothetical protein